MSERHMYLINGDKLIKRDEQYFIIYDGEDKTTPITSERGEELIFETNEMLRTSLIVTTTHAEIYKEGLEAVEQLCQLCADEEVVIAMGDVTKILEDTVNKIHDSLG